MRKFLGIVLFLALQLISTVTFAKSQTIINDSCPNFSVIEPQSPVRAGEPMEFTVQAKDIDEKNISGYNWSVSAGLITNGQGSPKITVDTKGLEGATITATVSVEGNFLDVCEKKASGSGVVEQDRKADLIDKFSASAGNCEEVQARMDRFFIELGSDPTATGYIIIYGTARATASVERIVIRWIRFRNFDPSRITTVHGGGNIKPANMELWIVPAGAIPPKPSAQVETDEPAKPDEKPVVMKKPYIFDSHFITLDGGGCLDEHTLDIESYALSLKENPKSRGNIVIYETSKKSFYEKEKEILTELKETGLDRRKIKTFFVKVKPATLTRSGEGVELWLLPKI